MGAIAFCIGSWVGWRLGNILADKLSRLEAILAAYGDPQSMLTLRGRISEASPSHFQIVGLSQHANIGDLVSIETQSKVENAEVVQIDKASVLAIPFQRQSRVNLGDRVTLLGRPSLRPHPSWLGRVIDPLGQPVDDLGALQCGANEIFLDRDPPRAMDRNRIQLRLRTGVKAIDIFTPLCSGQRVGIFAGSGVGKSTLLSMLSAIPDATTVVLALVGERGREVREFLEDVLGHRRERVIAVVATGDDNPAIRRLAPKAAMTIAEYFRECGENVLLMIDSITRFAHAQRECALAGGEPPVARGYPPSVFSEIARLLERAGPGPRGQGNVTALVTVLVDGDNHNDPIADAARGILDGHIVLDRKIASQGRWPAIDVLASLSRLAPKAQSAEESKTADTARALIARFEDTRDLRLIGGYQAGTDAELDKAVAFTPLAYELLRQRPEDGLQPDGLAQMAKLLRG